MRQFNLMALYSSRRSQRFFLLTIVLLAIPAIAVHTWLTFVFPSYLGWQFAQDVLFAVAYCTLLALMARWRFFGPLSWPIALLFFIVWLLLVFSEGVSYYLQADTFNDRFFGNINPNNLRAGVHAFPWMIGGGVVLLLVLLGAAGWLLRAASVKRSAESPNPSRFARALVLIVLMAIMVVVDSTPHRLVKYLLRYEKSFAVAASPAARGVYRKINADPISRSRLRASPGRNVVIIYLESLERMYTNPKVFPGLTPNLDRWRKKGLDFPGFETFSGATYTIAGMFASQCGAPLFSSPFSAFDAEAGNNNNADTFHPGIVCLGDVLHAAGYDQVFMEGAPMSFSNKDLFYKLHGYNRGLGLDELEAAHGGELRKEGWGLYDRELLKLALEKYRELERKGKPFNLSMITLDTHPPQGRPSPDCPRYAASNNDVLQATHCTDYLVGRFIDDLSKEPDFKNTVILVMSDHLEMRNDAESLYPKGYHRHPLLFFLNAGQGQRFTRIYHMDIPPILLDLMGVRTNATFVAGTDRSAVGAVDNPLVDNEVTRAVLRETLWSKNGRFRLCKDDSLLGWTSDNAFRIGGHTLQMDNLGVGEVAPRNDQVLTFFVNHDNASLLMAGRKNLTGLLAQRGDASALMIRPRYDPGLRTGLFSVDWMGLHGAVAHIADIPRLQDLSITSSQCKELITSADNAKAGTALDYSKQFTVSTAPRFPELAPSPAIVKFDQDQEIRPYRGEIGWNPAEAWGSWTIGNKAYLEFSLPAKQCHQAGMQFGVHPFLPASRPNLDVNVVVNGKTMTVWHFNRGQLADQTVKTPVLTDDGKCRVSMRFDFSRPGAKAPPYPAGEDPRALGLDFKTLRLSDPPPPK